MDADLERLVRERYPFPIAHTYQKISVILDDNAQKLQAVIQTAEVIVQFMALLALAQLYRDLETGCAPPLQIDLPQLRDDLRNPSPHQWQHIAQNILRSYRDHRDLLVIPELFDFYVQPMTHPEPPQPPVTAPDIASLMTLCNQYHPVVVSDSLITTQIQEGLSSLNSLLSKLQFLSHYPFVFVQDIKVRRQNQKQRLFSHELMHMQGCFSVFQSTRWDSDIELRHEHLIMLAPHTNGRNLALDPFITVANQQAVFGVWDIFLLKGAALHRARYRSVQCVQEFATDDDNWPKGPDHLEALSLFFDLLRHNPVSSGETEPSQHTQSAPLAIQAMTSHVVSFSDEVAHRDPISLIEHCSPYKFLDPFAPEDAALFFGRERELQQLQRKFQRARLLILHGASGTGKTSLIRAGFIPRLPPESSIPVYVRALQEPTRMIKEELVRQLGVDQRHFSLPFTEFLAVETTHVSKTLVIILDQFEEFFLQCSVEDRAAFHQALGACAQASHLDVRIIIVIREDSFSDLAEFQEAVPDIFTHEMRLNRLTIDQAFEAIIEPLKNFGASIDESLVSKVILPQLNDEAEGIDPSLLQIVCDRLYPKVQSRGQTAIGIQEYEALGDVHVMLEAYLANALKQFGSKKPQAQTVLKALVQAEGSRQAATLETLTSYAQTMNATFETTCMNTDFLRPLVQTRLVRLEELDGHSHYQLAHDCLAHTIGTRIADCERELTTVLAVIDRAYQTYQSTDLRLELEALDFIAPFESELELPLEQQQFLDLSKQAARRQQRRRWVRLSALLLVIALGVVMVLGWALD